MGKIELFVYDDGFIEIFRRERERILKILPGCKVYHIGSTAVPGLGGKGIVDIMIGLKDWGLEGEVVEKLRGMGFEHVHPKRRGRIFLSRVGQTKRGDIHLHLVRKGGREWRRLLGFRDYLRDNPGEAARYYKLKLKWIGEAKGDRDGYGRKKDEYMRGVLKRAGK